MGTDPTWREWQKQLPKHEKDLTHCRPCFCIGPQNGEPFCPCEMRARGVFKRDGRWIEPEHELGPVR